MGASPNKIADGAYGLYEADLAAMSALHVGIYGLLPTAYDGDQSGHWIDVDGIEVKQALLGVSFRLTAPSGFNWIYEPSMYYQEYPRNSVGRQVWPCGSGSGKMAIAASTQVRWQECNFQSEVLYGFALKAMVPDFSPSYGANVFYLEVGYLGKKVNTCGITKAEPCRLLDSPNSRMMAMQVEAPLVQSLRQCQIIYQTRRMSAENTLTVTFFLVTALSHTGNGLRIEGLGKNAEIKFTCDEYTTDDQGSILLVERRIQADFSGGTVGAGLGQQQSSASSANKIPVAYFQDTLFSPDGLPYKSFPADYQCNADTTGVLIFAVRTRPFKGPGYYRFTIPIVNLNYDSASRDTFRFSTWMDVLAEDYQKNPLDIGVETEGFEILSELTDARLVKFSSAGTAEALQIEREMRISTGRDDRPGYPDAPQKNVLLFTMKLKDTPNVKAPGKLP